MPMRVLHERPRDSPLLPLLLLSPLPLEFEVLTEAAEAGVGAAGI